MLRPADLHIGAIARAIPDGGVAPAIWAGVPINERCCALRSGLLPLMRSLCSSVNRIDSRQTRGRLPHPPPICHPSTEFP